MSGSCVTVTRLLKKPDARLAWGAALIATFCITSAGCSSDNWNSKAVENEVAASQAVGGFSDQDKRLYHLGLQHIHNLHQRVGAFTIGQVIDQERSREQSRAQARQEQASRRLDQKATANLVSSIKLANTTLGVPMYRGGVIKDDDCAIKIDGDYYERASDQDRSLTKQTVVTMCSASYTELGGSSSRKLPDNGLHVHLYNLANEVIYSDLVTRGPDAPTARVRPRTVANVDPHATYKVLQHWDIPCSGKGGFGEKVMALSHRQADLEAVLKLWMAEHNPDKTQCISLMAFSSQQSYEASEHPSEFTDAQLRSIPIGLEYINNPNTGYEGWTIGGEEEHVIHKASQ